ncbi:MULTISPECIES: sigma-70 family RNA polymerase sigma factor [Streptomyces]|uniref:sigma-70 family RNA polymerase sigma factor n=1 Tax=Streptomyces TaxID=1883 RepID=UPI000241B749|nr:MULTISPECIES: sigma-70 family RNA polymerase sigma factor [Streptomyces]EHM31589.1 RNA polymerase ECF-subfamily sigma factor [Streptomyces sp. W007]WSI76458.1 sigma-70 family RNA polymerase sigma factor [Streptomyces anulatus]WTD29121.1 sigma-70 family RNA polymerase sigma factor [Streptomyces anulatus]
MTLLDHDPGPAASTALVVRSLQPLVRAEARAEAPAAGLDPADLEQGVWVRLLERPAAAGPLTDAARWVRDTVRAEARRGRRAARRERPYAGGEPATGPADCPERAALGAAERRALRSAVARLPGHCPRLLEAMLAPSDPTYREIAGELGMSQGSLGPIRSRCLGCLRRMLAAEVVAPSVREGSGRQPANR